MNEFTFDAKLDETLIREFFAEQKSATETLAFILTNNYPWVACTNTGSELTFQPIKQIHELLRIYYNRFHVRIDCPTEWLNF